MEFVRKDCSRLEEEAKYEKRRCYRLLLENIQEIGAFAELYPCDSKTASVNCLNYNVREVTDAIVRKYSKQLAEFVRNQLVTKYALNSFSTIGVRLLAPAINEEHIKVDVRRNERTESAKSAGERETTMPIEATNYCSLPSKFKEEK